MAYGSTENCSGLFPLGTGNLSVERGYKFLPKKNGCCVEFQLSLPLQLQEEIHLQGVCSQYFISLQ